jgi:ribonuclease HI
MQKYIAYTDGSFGDNGEVHGGIVFWNGNAPVSQIHIKCTNPAFVSMRNVGGEVLAAWSAITSVAANVQKKNEELMDTYQLDLIYDYKGVGEWLTGGWKTNKPATQWFVKSVRDILEQVPNLKINYIWVKGHADNAGNTYADRTAAYDMSYCKGKNIPICNLDKLINL